MFVVLGRRILKGKLGVFSARHESSFSVSTVHERENTALLLSLKQTSHVSPNEYLLNRQT